MQIKVQVITREHRTWPAREGMASGEAYSLICQDMSLPGEDRMTEPLNYKLTDQEKAEFWDGTIDKTLVLSVKRFATNKTGKVSAIGSIKDVST